jgi:hypothetical protein
LVDAFEAPVHPHSLISKRQRVASSDRASRSLSTPGRFDPKHGRTIGKSAIDLDGKAQKKCAGVRCGFVQIVARDFEGLTLRTARLFKISGSFEAKPFRNFFAQDLSGSFGIFPIHAKLDAAQQVGPQPVHPNRGLVNQKTFQPG